MPKDEILNFNHEFNHIEYLIERKMYRHAGYACGYMLEYMLLKICKALKAHAGHDLSIALAALIKDIKNGSELDKFGLGDLIKLINKPDPLKNKSSNRDTQILLNVARRILKVSNQQVVRIDFSNLTDIRNNCAHPYKPYPSLNDIKQFKSVLKISARDFEEIFPRELAESQRKPPPNLLILSASILSPSALGIIFYMLKDYL